MPRPNVDRITDFNVVQDTIRLENGVMPGLGSHLGTLYSTAFWKSTTGLAHDANDRIIYETDTGWLNYDSNGSAAGGTVHIAQLAPNLALTNADFLIIFVLREGAQLAGGFSYPRRRARNVDR